MQLSIQAPLEKIGHSGIWLSKSHVNSYSLDLQIFTSKFITMGKAGKSL